MGVVVVACTLIQRMVRDTSVEVAVVILKKYYVSH
jgi:hypothetical protein